ncbi:hypothetical protein Poli38472_011121 [Pythium oligandrum]|uniref:ABC-2 type transporter transmembrane domain-containing protein n=1 Tax=Pythium oligandrum TaxID=41045 RepID=A0A8K1FLT8_PYTOL|nr:hypothetical protein Poli38472_011121 [Pythium oligandrum]|eukprot:TMW67501.1 hypothetical protein Poli38472_011121 [Pythium oligandrum]
MNFETFQGINAGLGGVFNATTFISLVAFQGIMPVAVGERAAFYRERASQTYNSLWFSLSIIVVEIPYVLFTSLVFCAIFFPMAGFTGGSTFVLYWIYTFLHVLSQAYIGLFLSVALPSLELAMIVGIIFNTLFFLFMGYIPPAASIPKGYRWLHDAIPIKYSTSPIGSVLFGGDCNDGSSSLGCRQVANLPPIFPANSTIQEYMDLAFAMKLDERTLSVGVVCVYIGGFALLIVLALRFLNHQKR